MRPLSGAYVLLCLVCGLFSGCVVCWAPQLLLVAAPSMVRLLPGYVSPGAPQLLLGAVGVLPVPQPLLLALDVLAVAVVHGPRGPNRGSVACSHAVCVLGCVAAG